LTGVPAVHYEYDIRTMGTDPDGALCGECEEDFIVWLKYANS